MAAVVWNRFTMRVGVQRTAPIIGALNSDCSGTTTQRRQTDGRRTDSTNVWVMNMLDVYFFCSYNIGKPAVKCQKNRVTVFYFRERSQCLI